MIEIPQQLKNPDFRFCLIFSKSKIPFEKDWGNTKNYSYDFPTLQNHLTNGGNYGVNGGFGNLAGVDADYYEVQQRIKEYLPETFMVQSGGTNEEDKEHPEKIHAYYKITDGLPKTFALKKDKKNVGHIRWHGGQLVGPGSTHESGNTYKIINDKPIAEITKEQLFTALLPYLDEAREEKTVNEEINNSWEKLDITKICGVSKLTSRGNGKYQGGHPFHNSKTNWDFELDTNKNNWFCFGHATGGGPWELLAIKQGLIDCSDIKKGCLKQNNIFGKLLEIAKRDYNYLPPKNKQESIKEETHTALKFLTSTEILNTPKEKGFIVKNMIPLNSVNQFVAPTAGLKSIIASHLALAVSNGKPFLGFQTKKTVTLYLDKENPRQTIAERIKLMKKGMGLNRKKFPLFYLLKQGELLDPHFVENLKDYVEKNKVGFIILDTLMRFNSEGDENSAKDINQIYASFIKIMGETKCSILFLHHTSKDNLRYRGSSDIMGLCDGMFQIVRKDIKNGKFVLKNTKNRLGEINDISGEVLFSPTEIKFIITQEQETEEQADYDRFAFNRAFILKYAKETCPTELTTFTKAGLITEMEAWNSDTHDKPIIQRSLERALDWLIKKKVLIKADKRGEYYYKPAQNECITKWTEEINQDINKRRGKDE